MKIIKNIDLRQTLMSGAYQSISKLL